MTTIQSVEGNLIYLNEVMEKNIKKGWELLSPPSFCRNFNGDNIYVMTLIFNP